MVGGWGAAALLPLAMVANGGVSVAAPGDAFNRVFAAAGEPATIHYRVMYRGPDGVHHLQVWRDHDRRIKRATDGVIASFAFRNPKIDGYRLSILDYKRHIHTIVDRTNLYRIGEMADWFDIGHGLRHPAGEYALTPGAAPAGMPATPAPCRWYNLLSAGRQTRICWDTAHRLPLLITTDIGRLLWRVTAVDTGSIPADTFKIDDRGFVRNDANRDIDSD